VALGFIITHWRGESFTHWLESYPSDAALWALIGAFVVGGAIYSHRIFSS
jgi:hypothetical protein